MKNWHCTKERYKMLLELILRRFGLIKEGFVQEMIPELKSKGRTGVLQGEEQCSSQREQSVPSTWSYKEPWEFPKTEIIPV